MSSLYSLPSLFYTLSSCLLWLRFNAAYVPKNNPPPTAPIIPAMAYGNSDPSSSVTSSTAGSGDSASMNNEYRVNVLDPALDGKPYPLSPTEILPVSAYGSVTVAAASPLKV